MSDKTDVTSRKEKESKKERRKEGKKERKEKECVGPQRTAAIKVCTCPTKFFPFNSLCTAMQRVKL